MRCCLFQAMSRVPCRRGWSLAFHPLLSRPSGKKSSSTPKFDGIFFTPCNFSFLNKIPYGSGCFWKGSFEETIWFEFDELISSGSPNSWSKARFCLSRSLSLHRVDFPGDGKNAPSSSSSRVPIVIAHGMLGSRNSALIHSVLAIH